MDKDNFRGFALLGGPFATHPSIVAVAKHQEEVIQVMCVLPGKHRYEQVEAAIRASGVSPHDIYLDLAANQQTVALARFYEALQGEVRT